jgi:TIR domain
MGGGGGTLASSQTASEMPGPTVAERASRPIFLSYASHDAETARSICQFLESHGAPCWMAPRDVKPGAQYADAIVAAINEANALVPGHNVLISCVESGLAESSWPR